MESSVNVVWKKGKSSEQVSVTTCLIEILLQLVVFTNNGGEVIVFLQQKSSLHDKRNYTGHGTKGGSQKDDNVRFSDFIQLCIYE